MSIFFFLTVDQYSVHKTCLILKVKLTELTWNKNHKLKLVVNPLPLEFSNNPVITYSGDCVRFYVVNLVRFSATSFTPKKIKDPI